MHARRFSRSPPRAVFSIRVGISGNVRELKWMSRLCTMLAPAGCSGGCDWRAAACDGEQHAVRASASRRLRRRPGQKRRYFHRTCGKQQVRILRGPRRVAARLLECFGRNRWTIRVGSAGPLLERQVMGCPPPTCQGRAARFRRECALASQGGAREEARFWRRCSVDVNQTLRRAMCGRVASIDFPNGGAAGVVQRSCSHRRPCEMQEEQKLCGRSSDCFGRGLWRLHIGKFSQASRGRLENVGMDAARLRWPGPDVPRLLLQARGP